MNPRLIAISGPLEGKTIPLSGERFVLGRQTGCDLQIPSVEVSRRHCELRRGSHGSWTVLDLDSRHGVFVNHRPVREGRLAHSDLLSVGTSVLLFLLDEASPGSRSGAFEPPPAGVSAGSTLTRHASDLLYLDRSRVEDALPAQARIARDLHALLRASTALQGPLDVTELGRRLLAAAAEVCPAERLALSTLEAGDESPVPVCRRRRGSDTEADFDPSPAVLEQVIGERAGILWTLADDQAPTRSLIAAPLLDPRGRVNAVLQAESPVEDAFEERHLELLGALAGIASPALENALRWRRLEAEAERLKAQQLSHDLVGESPSIVRLLELIARVARVDTTVLIRGESGTGKELVAQAIHRSSERARGPFVAINCATLSETLIESELFGHEKGAFTGAIASTTGKIQAAAGGTLFLDEIGELPVGLQAKLLRVLEERRFVRLGGTRPIDADVRVVAATNRDLETAIRQGLFRQDLYYRLKVITLETPPLRARRDDIPLLALHFLDHHGRRLGRRGVALAPAARRCLLAYPWPGNVRELGNVIERALVLGDTDEVLPEDLPEELREGAEESPGDLQAALDEFKRRTILDAYRDAGRDYSAAAATLGVHVNSLHRMIRRLGIKDELED